MKLPSTVEQALAEQKMATRFCPHRPHPKQREFIELDCLEALYGGAAGGGKSDALLMAALRYVKIPGYSAILFRRTYTELALPEAIMARSHEWLAGSEAHWSGETKTWTFPSGATLSFGYLDSPNDHFRYQGAAFQFVGWDELTQWAVDTQYRYLFSRLRRLEGARVPLRVRAATNPGGLGHEWVKARFIDRPGDRRFVPATLEDNLSLDRAAYESALSELDPITYAQLRKGEWVRDPSGLVYSSFDDAKNITAVVPMLPPDETWTYVLGCDFGVTDPTAFVVLAFAEHDPTVYVLQSEEWPGLAPSDASDIAKAWDETYHFERIVGDIGGLGKGFEAEWRKRYTPMTAAKKENKLGYIKLLNGDFHHGRVRIVEGTNAKLISDLRTLAWLDDKHTKEHPGLDNHLPDALLYAWREARHWNWEERERKPATPEEEARAYAAERKAKIAARNRRAQDPDNDDWIIGP